jgi:hypothetical protein
MKVGKPRGRLRRLLGATAAFAVASSVAVFAAHDAGAQTAELALRKSVSLNPAQVAPGDRFTFFLSYSCSSLSDPCRGARITDVLPPQLSRAAADVELGGNFDPSGTTYDPATGTVSFALFDPLAPGTTAQVSISVEFPPAPRRPRHATAAVAARR